MKNILGALAIAAIGSVSVAGSANAVPAASLAGLDAASSVEQVGFKRHGFRKFHGKFFFVGHKFYGRKFYGYGYGGDYGWWKKYCYSHPYHWKCKKFGFDYY